MPYSNRDLKEYDKTRDLSPEWDLWSLGVIILEVLVGSEVVATVDSDQRLRDLLTLIAPLIPSQLFFIVSEMTIFCSGKNIQSIIDRASEKNHDLVMEAVNECRRFRLQSPLKQEILPNFKNFMEIVGIEEDEEREQETMTEVEEKDDLNE